MKFSLNIACVVTFLSIGCGVSDSRQTGPVPTAKATPLETTSNAEPSSRTVHGTTEKVIGGMRFEIPAGWDEKALSSTMILGEFSLPGSAGAGRLTLSTAGGGTAANMDRWKGQFQRGANDPEPIESQISVAGKDVTMIEVYGTYSDMFGGGGPKSNWQLLGVAIPVDSQQNYFVKLTGPRETVSARREEYLKFIGSARFEK